MPGANAESPVSQAPTTGSAGNGDCPQKRKVPLEDVEASPDTPHGQGFEGQKGQLAKRPRVHSQHTSKDERPRPAASWAQNLAKMIEEGNEPPRIATKPRIPRAATPPSPYREPSPAHDPKTRTKSNASAPRSESSSPSPRHSRRTEGDAKSSKSSDADPGSDDDYEPEGASDREADVDRPSRRASASSAPSNKERSSKSGKAVKVTLRKSGSGQPQSKQVSTDAVAQDQGSSGGEGNDAGAPASSSGAAHPEQTQAAPAIPLPTYNGNHTCSRTALAECEEEEFMADLKTIWDEISKTKKKTFAKSKNEDGKLEYSHPVLNGKPLDFFSLYKEVACRGGFHNCDGINWTGQVFTRMSNFSTGHHQTGVGNALKKHYVKYLMEYELAHPDDVIPDDKCIECGCVESSTTSKVDWICCAHCSGWVHYQCDKRASIYSFRDYAYNGVDYVCSKCSASAPKRNAAKA